MIGCVFVCVSVFVCVMLQKARCCKSVVPLTLAVSKTTLGVTERLEIQKKGGIGQGEAELNLLNLVKSRFEGSDSKDLVPDRFNRWIDDEVTRSLSLVSVVIMGWS